MSFSVNTNSGAAIALQNLNRTNRSLEQNQLRLATGLKVNGPKDDAATYTIAQTMRGDIAGMKAVKTALSAGEATVDVAIDAAKAMSDLLLEMKSKIVQANQAGLDATSRTALDNDFRALRAQLDTIAETAEFNGTNLVKSGLTTKTALTGLLIPANFGWTDYSIAVAEGDIIDITASGTVGYATGVGFTATPDGSSYGPVQFGTTLATEENVHTLVGRIGHVLVNDPSGFAVGSSSAEIADASGNLILGFNDTVVNANRIGYDAPQLTDNSGAFSLDVNISSVGDLSVLSTPDGDSITVEGHYLTSRSLGLDRIDLSSAGTAKNGLREIDRAITAVSKALVSLGASAKRLELQSRFTTSLNDIVTAGVGDLVDADMAQEAARLQAEQTRQQLGVQALAIANATPQSILSLFGS